MQGLAQEWHQEAWSLGRQRASQPECSTVQVIDLTSIEFIQNYWFRWKSKSQYGFRIGNVSWGIKECAGKARACSASAGLLKISPIKAPARF